MRPYLRPIANVDRTVRAGPWPAGPFAPFASPAPAADNSSMLVELFGFENAASVGDWTSIDDGVMGGLSRSRLRHDGAGHAVFEGVVSLENNGGFASVRARPRAVGIPGGVAFVVDVLGDGRRYKLNLRTDNAFDGVNYQAGFAPAASAWTRVRLPLAAFRPTFRGRDVPAAPPLDPARVQQIGLMIADAQAGPFALLLRAISGERAATDIGGAQHAAGTRHRRPTAGGS
jgi:NADH dehydrogenase [ubiquinone] 1 alpha subcomplex assembly factor 1